MTSPTAAPSSISFPSQPPVYLDCHATTPVDPRVLEAMLPYWRERFGNAASVNHAYGWQAAEAVEQARATLARWLGTTPQSLIFTSGATEANNLALKGVMRRSAPGSHLVIAAAEHRAVLDPARRLAREGYRLTVLPVDRYGAVDPQQVTEAIEPGAALVSVMLANNEVGTINPIREIGEVCRRRGVLLHCDASQGAGRMPLDLESLPVDLLSLSGHKLYAPQGIGALYIRRNDAPVRLEPLLEGGGHEQRLRSGTLPVALIVGLGCAGELLRTLQADESIHIATLRDRLWQGLQSRLTGLTLNGHPVNRLPGNLHVSVEGVDGEALMHALKEIAVSSGSACTSADPEPSHVLRAMGISEALSKASVRFGLGRMTTDSQIDFAMDYFADVVQRLRAGPKR
ncbi:MAG: cysteine desulfurase family protein [Planctomycetales bacterium]